MQQETKPEECWINVYGPIAHGRPYTFGNFHKTRQRAVNYYKVCAEAALYRLHVTLKPDQAPKGGAR